jgi:hypothetical protein
MTLSRIMVIITVCIATYFWIVLGRVHDANIWLIWAVLFKLQGMENS